MPSFDFEMPAMSEAGVQGAKALTGAISEACSEAECI